MVRVCLDIRTLYCTLLITHLRFAHVRCVFCARIIHVCMRHVTRARACVSVLSAHVCERVERARV